MKGYKKAQLNLPNFVMLFVVFLIALFMLPVMNTVIEATAGNLSASGGANVPLTISIMQLIPFALILGIILTAIYYAIPRQGGGQY